MTYLIHCCALMLESDNEDVEEKYTKRRIAEKKRRINLVMLRGEDKINNVSAMRWPECIGKLVKIKFPK